MPLCVLVVFHTWVTIVTVRSLISVHRPRYFRFCNVYGQSGPSLLIESTDSMIMMKHYNVVYIQHSEMYIKMLKHRYSTCILPYSLKFSRLKIFAVFAGYR